jgi:hypothetical protein
MKAFGSYRVQLAKIPSKCPSIIRAARANSSSNSSICSRNVCTPPSVPQVVAHSLDIGLTHVNRHMLAGIGIAVVPQQFRSTCLPNLGIPPGGGKQHHLGHQVGKHHQLVVLLAPVNLVGSHRHYILEAQPRVRRIQMGEDHPPYPKAAVAKDLNGTLDLHLTHQAHCQSLALLGEAFAKLVPGRGHTVHLAVIATASSRLGPHDHALLCEEVEMQPLHRLDKVVAGHRWPGLSTLFMPQTSRLLHLQQEGRGACFKPCLQ